jgi:hypothetical protein
MISKGAQNAGSRALKRADRLQDFLLVSCFGLWATLLGLVPPLAFSLLRGS